MEAIIFSMATQFEQFEALIQVPFYKPVQGHVCYSARLPPLSKDFPFGIFG